MDGLPIKFPGNKFRREISETEYIYIHLYWIMPKCFLKCLYQLTLPPAEYKHEMPFYPNLDQNILFAIGNSSSQITQVPVSIYSFSQFRSKEMSVLLNFWLTHHNQQLANNTPTRRTINNHILLAYGSQMKRLQLRQTCLQKYLCYLN